MTELVDIENRAGICRVTCGWKKPQLSLEVVRRYWRDVHSPGISRRPGIYEYRHQQFDPVHAGLFTAISSIEFSCPADAQLMWLSDVRYLDQANLQTFGATPAPDIRALLLGDIDIIVERSTTYLALGDKAHTLSDRSGDPAPQGPAPSPCFALFVRQRGAADAFRDCLRDLTSRWSAMDGVIRVRLSLFEVPDMEAERKAGYPVKTHPPEQQYQAWIDLVVEREQIARSLLQGSQGAQLASEVHTLHAYPVPVMYTPVYRGRPTLVGLRGYPAFDAMRALHAENQKQHALIDWMYGEHARGGPFA